MNNLTIGSVMAGLVILIGILLILSLPLGPVAGMVLVGLALMLVGIMRFVP
jgi:hypothetical protein